MKSASQPAPPGAQTRGDIALGLRPLWWDDDRRNVCSEPAERRDRPAGPGKKANGLTPPRARAERRSRLPNAQEMAARIGVVCGNY